MDVWNPIFLQGLHDPTEVDENSTVVLKSVDEFHAKDTPGSHTRCLAASTKLLTKRMKMSGISDVVEFHHILQDGKGIHKMHKISREMGSSGPEPLRILFFCLSKAMWRAHLSLLSFSQMESAWVRPWARCDEAATRTCILEKTMMLGWIFTPVNGSLDCALLSVT